MSCTGCATSFGLLRKEHACNKCGFSHCAKCLSHKAVVARVDPKNPVPVCTKCYRLLTTTLTPGVDAPRPRDPSFQTNEPPIAVILPSTLHYSQANKDKDIAERLERLRAERMGNRRISQDEVELRLARLKDGTPPVVSSHSDNQQPTFKVDSRTQAEQTRDLFAQMHAEAALDQKWPSPEQEIATRLAKLRDKEPPKSTGSTDSHNDQKPEDVLRAMDSNSSNYVSEDPSVDEVHKLLNQAKLEANKEASAAMDDLRKDQVLHAKLMQLKNEQKGNLEKKKSASAVHSDDSDEDDSDKLVQQILNEGTFEETLRKLTPPPGSQDVVARDKSPPLPWCCICNEDAMVQCTGCDGDLYCHRCYREGHDSFDLKDHRVIPYRR